MSGQEKTFFAATVAKVKFEQKKTPAAEGTGRFEGGDQLGRTPIALN
ncbi:hypothetical protein ACDY96_16850 [Rhizobium mongolense]